MYFFIATILIALDQATKLWATSTLPLGGPEWHIWWAFHFTYVRNSGAAFGILQDSTIYLALLSALVSVALVVYMLRSAKFLPHVQRFALSLVLAGAVGNMIDRFRLGYVIDFIHFRLPNFNFPVFNIADSAVVVGAGLLLLHSFWMDFSRKSRAEAVALREDAE